MGIPKPAQTPNGSWISRAEPGSDVMTITGLGL